MSTSRDESNWRKVEFTDVARSLSFLISFRSAVVKVSVTLVWFRAGEIVPPVSM